MDLSILDNEPYFMRKFLRTVQDDPDALMLVDDQSINYWTRERVNDMSARVYGYLQKRNIGRDDFVLILLPRGVLPFIAALGVWKAGAAFTILEDNYVPERIEFIKGDLGCKLVIDMDAWREIREEEPRPGFVMADYHDAAFAVYTSGSTGTPKGVVHEYGVVELHLLSLRGSTGMVPGLEHFALIAPLNFVASLLVFMNCFQQRRCLYVVPYSVAKNPLKFMEYLAQKEIDNTFLSPSMIRAVGKRIPPCVKTITTGSEPANGIYLDDATIYNNYSMSEGGFKVCLFKIDRPYDVCPVGKPMVPGLEIVLLDEGGNEVPQGETGEICFESYFTRGYVNLPEQTAAAFRDHIYHTGDLGRKDENGDLILVGRANDMIKIDGNRIEPAEIESAFKKVTGVAWCAAKGFENPEKSFVALYYKQGEDIPQTAAELRAAMGEHVPYYMIPSYFVPIEKLPLLPNGKLDRKALPDPSVNVQRAEYVAPRDDVERALCAAFEKVLGVDHVGVTENFYELGGKSVLAMELVAEVGLEALSAVDVFQGATPERIAQIYREKTEGQEDITEEEKEMRARQVPHFVPPVIRGVIDYQLFTPKAPMWIFPFLFSFGEDADPRRVLEAGRKVMENHPIFSTVFEFNEDCELQQRYDESKRARLLLEYMSDWEFEDFKQRPLETFDVLGEPMVRLRVIQTDSNVYMMLVFHHVVMDGSSMQLIFKSIADAYTGEPLDLDTYYSYLEDAERLRETSAYQQAYDYYQENYEGIDWVYNIESDVSEPGNVNATFGISSSITPDNLARMEQTCGISRNGFMIAVCSLALAKLSCKNDVITSFVFHNRVDQRRKSAGGLLSSTLPVGLRLEEYDTLADLYAGIAKQSADGIANSAYDWVVESENAYERDVFALVYETSAIMDMSFLERMGAGLEPLDARNEAALRSTMLQVFERPDSITFLLSYMKNAFSNERIAAFGDEITLYADYLIDVGDPSSVKVADLLRMSASRDEEARMLLGVETHKNRFYDPIFYIANEDHPFVMSSYFTLLDEVDGEALAESVEELRERFPYFYVRVKAIEQELRSIPNPLPVCVRNDWERTVIGSKDNNYHLLAVKYEGKRLCVEIAHSLTDGAGVMPYLKALLYLYFTKVTEDRLNPAGLRLPGTDFVKGELGCPYSMEDIAKVKKPMLVKQPVDFYKFEEGPVPMDGEKKFFFLQFSGEDMLRFCRENDGSPNAVLAVLMARAIRAIDPQMSRDITIGIGINQKALLGNYENYNFGTDTIGIDFPASRPLDDLGKSCTIARGQIIAQTITDNVLYAVKQRKASLEKIDMLNLVQQKIDLLKDLQGNAVASAIVSYTGNRTLGDMDAYIDEFYCITDAAGTDMLLELNYLNGTFYLAVIQNFSSDAYVKALMDQLGQVDIACKLVSAEDNWTATTRFEDAI
ncbi:MAG: AMP-binding protein [Eggerthellaceae bacterium]|nr:AMP-binding protein [Eggerthellaceae bacterium]